MKVYGEETCPDILSLTMTRRAVIRISRLNITSVSRHSAAAAAAARSLQSGPTLCDPIDGGPPGSPVPGILQARALEWVAISFSKTRK